MARSPSVFVHVLLLVILLNGLVVITGSVLHELGHAALGHLAGCTDIQVVLFDGGLAATRMACPATANMAVLAVGASVFVVPAAGLFLLLRAVPEQSIGWILLGVHIVGSTADLHRTALPDVAALYGAPFLGVLLILHGENQLISQLLDAHAVDHLPQRRA